MDPAAQHVDKWALFLKQAGIDPSIASKLVQNTSNWMAKFIKSVDSKEEPIGNFTEFAFPMIRKTAPQLVAQNLVSVQPMTSLVGGINFYKPKYGAEPELPKIDSTVQIIKPVKGKVIAGTVMKHTTSKKDGYKRYFVIVDDANTGRRMKFEHHEVVETNALDTLTKIDLPATRVELPHEEDNQAEVARDAEAPSRPEEAGDGSHPRLRVRGRAA